MPLLALAGASALGVALIVTRAILLWRGQHLFLAWNLFLAWVPLLLALRLEHQLSNGAGRAARWLTGLGWLFFLPNAPYILTDLTHLKPFIRWSWWTDLLLILWFAVIGLVLAFLALHRMQLLVAQRRGWLTGWAFVVAVAFLCGFGVYLGRFERWNSWDVVTNPTGLLADSLSWLHGHAARFTLLFGLFLSTTHALLYSLTLVGRTERVPAIVPVQELPRPTA